MPFEKIPDFVVASEQVKIKGILVQHFKNQAKPKSCASFKKSASQFSQTDAGVLMRPAHDAADPRDGFADNAAVLTA